MGSHGDSRDPEVTDNQGTPFSAMKKKKYQKTQTGDVLQDMTVQGIHTGKRGNHVN